MIVTSCTAFCGDFEGHAYASDERRCKLKHPADDDTVVQ